MDLNISEFDDYSEYNEELYNEETYEHIPENNSKINVIKKTVRFDNKPEIKQPKPGFSYEDILLKMGMFVDNGKLHLINNSQEQYPQQQYLQQKQYSHQQQYQQQQQQEQYQQNIPQNSYIYNKYFKDQLNNSNDDVNRPLTPIEYRNKLIQDIIQKHKLKKLKSTKLVMPTSNISMGGGIANLNKLFNFSKR